MATLLARKLQSFVRLTDADKLSLSEAVGPGRPLPAHVDILEHGEDPQVVNVILDGWACRLRLLSDGRRQIVSLMLPGDLCDTHVFLLDRMDHTVSTLTPVIVAQLSKTALRSATARSQSLTYAFDREGLSALAIQREWAVSLGRRSGIERLAHLFCELYARLEVVGLVDAGSCAMPLTQDSLADTLGQTSVHINRTLQELRGMGLVSLRGRRLTIHDWNGLAQLAHFDPTYLHFTEKAGPE